MIANDGGRETEGEGRVIANERGRETEGRVISNERGREIEEE